MKTIQRKSGFTLIELMIVVAITGILAAIAIPNFLRFQLKAKSSEGKTNLAAIRTAEESCFAEFNTYISASESPNQAPNNQKHQFTDPSGGFNTLGWAPEGNVYFTYGVSLPAAAPFSEYLASAAADIDADLTGQFWGYKTSGTPYGRVRVKVARLGERVVNVSPEYEDYRQVARVYKIPLKEVITTTISAARDALAQPGPGMQAKTLG